MKCPACGAAELVRDTQDLSYNHRGEATLISSVVGDFCPACGEAVLEMAEAARVSGQMWEFNAHVRASSRDEPTD